LPPIQKIPGQPIDTVLKRQHRDLRDDHLEDQATDLTARNGGVPVVSVQSLIARERKRRDFAYIKQITKPKHGKGITTIQIPDPANPNHYLLVAAPEKVEEKILHQTTNHFAQADSTPFATAPLQEVLE
jgi:hypothetical protein